MYNVSHVNDNVSHVDDNSSHVEKISITWTIMSVILRQCQSRWDNVSTSRQCIMSVVSTAMSVTLTIIPVMLRKYQSSGRQCQSCWDNVSHIDDNVNHVDGNVNHVDGNGRYVQTILYRYLRGGVNYLFCE